MKILYDKEEFAFDNLRSRVLFRHNPSTRWEEYGSYAGYGITKGMSKKEALAQMGSIYKK